MTEKIYYEDAYCRSFTAVVTDCRLRKDGYALLLDRTAFYPEGGGQPGDVGVLRTAGGLCVCVADTQEAEGEILHLTKEPFNIGEKVQGEIDWDYRFDLMQNHSGEHIVSGLIHEKYGYQNVGFHMGSDVLTIDLNGELSWEDLLAIEEKANEVVWKNEPTQIVTYDEEAVKEIEYRSKKELHGQVRIVTFPGADVCACCGTHVRSAGEIGLIKLLSAERFHGGTRIEMLCGKRAYRYAARICEQNHLISVLLSAKPERTAESVKRLKEAEAESNFRANALETKLFDEKAKARKGAGNVVLFEENLSPDQVRRLAVAVMESCGGKCAVFSGDDTDGYKYALGQTGGDLRSFVKELNASLKGRGGGKPFFAQGSVPATRGKIEAFFQESDLWNA